MVGKFNLEALEVVFVINRGSGVAFRIALCKKEDNILDKKITAKFCQIQCCKIRQHTYVAWQLDSHI